MRKFIGLLALVVFTLPASACDTLQTFRSFAVPSYAPAFTTGCGCDAGVLQAPVFRAFAAPVYAPQVFAAPVYAPRVFAAPVYAPAFAAFHSPVLRAAVVQPVVVRQRVVIRQRNVFGGAVVAPSSALSIRAPFFRFNSFRF